MMMTAARPAERDLATAFKRGIVGRCPSCGKGHLFRAYLKVAEHCDTCGEQLDLHRADDFPPYIAIMIVGHLLVGLMLHLDMVWHVDPLTYLYTLIPLAVILPLAMLPSIKGAIVGLQWANGMYGFGTGQRD